MRGLPLESDHPEEQELISYGLATFDNILFALQTTFVMVTLEGWTKVMYNLMDATVPILAVTICCNLVILCAFFLLNIILAVLAETVNKGDAHDMQALAKDAATEKSIMRALS